MYVVVPISFIGVDGTTYEIRAFREEIKVFNPRLMRVRTGSQRSL